MSLIGSVGGSISTHSLTRRLTDLVLSELDELENFNSQPHKEADCNFKQIFLFKIAFQLLQLSNSLH